jgi:hypothetical protein
VAEQPPRPEPRRRVLVRGYAALVVRVRSQAGLSGLVGRGNPAITAQVDAVQRFGLPLLSRTAVVQRDPGGLDPFVQADTALRALEVDKRTLDAGGKPDSELLLAYPLVNNPLLFPNAGEHNTTIVTYLFIAPTANLGEQDVIADDYAATLERPDGGLVGATGTIPRAGRPGPDRRRPAPAGRAGHAGGDRARRRVPLPLRRRPTDHTAQRGCRLPRRGPAHREGGRGHRAQRAQPAPARHRGAHPGHHHRLHHLLPVRSAPASARGRDGPRGGPGRGRRVPADRRRRRADRDGRGGHPGDSQVRAVPGVRPGAGDLRAHRARCVGHPGAGAAGDPRPLDVLARRGEPRHSGPGDHGRPGAGEPAAAARTLPPGGRPPERGRDCGRALPLGGLRAAVSPVAALVVARPGITGDRERLATLERLLDAQPEVARCWGCATSRS